MMGAVFCDVSGCRDGERGRVSLLVSAEQMSAQHLDWSSHVPQSIGARRAPADQLKGLTQMQLLHAICAQSSKVGWRERKRESAARNLGLKTHTQKK